MRASTLSLFTAPEQKLLLETERPRLVTLDEDALGDLHDRVRRARNKVVGQQRRTASRRVEAKGARGKAALGPDRNAEKAEVLEGALGRVSAQLAKVAKARAAELRAERLAAARTASGRPSAPTAARSATPSAPAPRSRRRTVAETKTAASNRASGKRRQAARDAR